MHHDLVLVAATVIAMAAATVAPWFAQRLEGPTSIAAAALLMGLTVSRMHYTGMIGVQV